ncbi:MAG: hypothetical protein WCD70_08535 [Alphaproteobacteria bacterium]
MGKCFLTSPYRPTKDLMRMHDSDRVIFANQNGGVSTRPGADSPLVQKLERRNPE